MCARRSHLLLLIQTFLNALGKSENVKALVTAIVTAGVLQGMGTTSTMQGIKDGASAPLSAESFVSKLELTAINTTVNTTINSAVYGSNFTNALGQNLKNAGIDTVSAIIANTIGASYKGDGGLLNDQYLLHKVSHAVLGCTSAATKQQDCGSGALGGVTGEVAAELIGGTKDGSQLTPAQQGKIVFFSQFTTAAVTITTGANLNTALATSHNAVVNNTFYLHNGKVVARDMQDNDKVVALSDKEARKLGVMDYEETGLGGMPVVSDKTILRFNRNTIYDLSDPQDFKTLKEGSDMGYYPSDANGNLDGSTRIYFQNGMDNKLEDAKATASLISEITGTPVGMIANDSHGIAGDTAEYLKLPQQTKDVLNEFTYRKLDQGGTPTLIVMHSAGNNDALQALRIGSLYDHQYPNLSFYSLGSPIGSNTLDEIISNTGGNYLGQVNDWRDPIPYSKTVGGGVLGATGYGIYLGAASGCVIGPLGCLLGGVIGGATGGLVTAGPGLYGLVNYHPMTNYLEKSAVVDTIQQWQLNNKP